jgi:hypothetical protein
MLEAETDPLVEQLAEMGLLAETCELIEYALAAARKRFSEFTFYCYEQCFLHDRSPGEIATERGKGYSTVVDNLNRCRRYIVGILKCREADPIYKTNEDYRDALAECRHRIDEIQKKKSRFNVTSKE